jgi:AcrR family transcriptional regulator
MSDADTQPSGKTDTALRLRQQIIEAANEHFSRYGYAKTTVSDLAKEIGFSKAYIYKFFDSKQAIGEAICRNCLDVILVALDKSIASSHSETDKVRRFVSIIAQEGVRLFFSDQKLYEIAAYSAAENWQSTIDYCTSLQTRLKGIIQAGRQSGEFERKTPLDEVCRAIMRVIQPFTNPLVLQHGLADAEIAASEVAGLILRSLAP